MSFAAVFAYEVEPAATAAFEAVYGPDGEWARFFSGADGYLGTELLAAEDGGVARYVVIDRWRSASAYEAFLEAQGPEYRNRNEAASGLYLRETVLGRFDAR